MPVYNLCAVPDGRRWPVFFRLAATMATKTSGYLLKEGESYPHATIIQFEACDDAQAMQMMRYFVGRKIKISTMGIHIKPEGKTLWVEQVIKRASDLMAVHSEVLQALPATTTLFSAHGEAFFPHFTYARVYKDEFLLPNALIHNNPLETTDVLGTIMLGRSDREWQVTSFVPKKRVWRDARPSNVKPR